MHKLYELKEVLCKELEEYAKRGSNLDLQSLNTIDILAHAIKNLDKIIGTSEYSNMGNSYEGGWSTRRGRYSYADMKEGLRKLIDSAPDEQTKNELMRMAQKFE